MLNVKQESSEYQLLKSFDRTRPGNRTRNYRVPINLKPLY